MKDFCPRDIPEKKNGAVGAMLFGGY